MATSQIDFSQQTNNPDPQSPAQERTPDSPSQQNPQESQKAVQLTDDLKKALMSIPSKYTTEWMVPRRQQVQAAMKKLEFYKGNQLYLAFDPYSDSFVSALDVAGAMNGNASGQGNTAKQDIYKNVTNIYQAFCRTYISVLSGGETPKVRFLPSDAEKVEDLETAEASSTLEEHIERRNKIRRLLKKAWLYLWVGPGYWRYVRYLVDASRAGTHKEPVTAMVNQPVTQDRYQCSSCGSETPEEQLNPMVGLACPQCANQLSGNDFYPGESMPMPTVVGQKDVPNGMTAQTIYNILYVEQAPNADDVRNTPILRLAEEVDIAYLRAAYPDSWNDIKKATGAAGSGVEGEVERIARQRIYSASAGRSYNMATAEMPTLYRTWITPEAFNKVEDESQAKQLQELFPTGCKLVQCGENFLEATEEKLTDHWTCCFTQDGFGTMAPGAGDNAVDIQERLNDVMSIEHRYMDRVASFPLIVNEELISTKALNGRVVGADAMIPVKMKQMGPGSSLDQAIFQPRVTIDPKIFSYSEKLIFLAQMLTGILPQTFGGAQEDIGDTFGAQRQALQTAKGKMMLDWEQVREECSDAAQISVRIEADAMKKLNRDMTEAVPGEGGEAINKYVMVSSLQGEAQAHPEADQGFPMTYDEMKDVLMQLAQFASKNPELFGPLISQPTNMKLFSLYVLPPGTVVPGDAERSKTLKIVNQLVKEQPIPGTDMMGMPTLQPSVEPDPDIDDFDEILATAKQYAIENYDVKTSNPLGWANLIAYIKAVGAAQKMKMIQDMPPMPPPDGENGEAPAPVGAGKPPKGLPPAHA